MSRNLKPALYFDEQLDRFKKRGMIIEDDATAESFLQHNNYYRISGYAFLFLKGNDKYQKGISFKHIMQLMEFDSELRRILFKELEYIEIYSRTQIAYWFSISHNKDGGAHYNPTFFVVPEYHDEYIANLQKQIDRNSSQPFVAHHINDFGGKMPLWCAVELLSFSTLSKLYSNMNSTDKELIAANMNTDAAHLENWLHCFSILRNSCAHYSRLYQTVFSPKISLDGKTLRKYEAIQLDTLFAYVIAMLRIIPEDEIKLSLIQSLSTLFTKNAANIDLSAIGFPENWESILADKAVVTLKPVSETKKTPISSSQVQNI